MIFKEHLGQPITHPFQTHPLLEVFSVSNCRLAEKSAENAARRYLKVHTQRCPYLCDREGGGAQEEAALVAHILALVSSDARRRGATLHMLVTFYVDVQQHSILTLPPQPQLTILYSAVHRHILPARCKYIVVVHQGGAYSTKLLLQACTGCFFVPFGLLFEKTVEFFKIGVILSCK